MKTKCSSECHAAAWLAGELSPGESAAFERHLSECAACRQNVDASRRVIARLQSLPAPVPQRDSAPDIMARLHAGPKVIAFPVRRPLPAMAAAVAALLVPAAVVIWLRDGRESGRASTAPDDIAAVASPAPDTEAAQVTRALDWFYTHQEIDGSWDPEKWGGNRRFKPALTALPLITLLKGAHSPEHHEAAQRALAWLRREQNEDGSFTRSFGDAGYNQSIGTLALLQAWQARPEPALKAAATAALQFALRTQTPGGAWGDAMKSDVSITLWYREALELAARLDWDGAAPALAKAELWLESRGSSAASAATAPEWTDLDYLNTYFAVTALLREGTAEASARLGAIRRQLASSQSRTGHYPGTWEPTDSWGRAGGRIYSTALATLALR